MNDYNKDNESSFLMYWDANNCTDELCENNYLLTTLKRKKTYQSLMKSLLKIMMEIVLNESYL